MRWKPGSPGFFHASVYIHDAFDHSSAAKAGLNALSKQRMRMNVHSHRSAIVQHLSSPQLGASAASSDRQQRILDAAERCFVRAGFHKATMQDVAAEAHMSAGNLYRYFPSKDALVAGLAERDRAEMGADFAALAQADDFVETFAALGRKHFESEPRDKAILCVEMWSEAARNPVFAKIVAEFEREMLGQMTSLFTQAQSRGTISSVVAPRDLAVLIGTLANGLFVRRAMLADFDAPREVGNVMAVIAGLLRGDVHIAAASHQEPSS